MVWRQTSPLSPRANSHTSGAAPKVHTGTTVWRANCALQRQVILLNQTNVPADRIELPPVLCKSTALPLDETGESRLSPTPWTDDESMNKNLSREWISARKDGRELPRGECAKKESNLRPLLYQSSVLTY